MVQDGWHLILLIKKLFECTLVFLSYGNLIFCEVEDDTIWTGTKYQYSAIEDR